MARKSTRRKNKLGVRSQKAKLRGLAAINRVRRGDFDNLSDAARAEGTTVLSIKKRLPAAVVQERPGGRIRVKPGDSYSAPVQSLTDDGTRDVSARNSRERELAGRHRSIYLKVLRGELPGSTLQEFRGKKVGGHELLSDPDRLFILAEAGVLNQLDALYVTPEARG